MTIEAVHPDPFLLDQLDLDPGAVLTCLRGQRADYSHPELSVAQFYRTFLATVPRFAHLAESLDLGSTHETLTFEDRPHPADLPLPLETRTKEEVLAAFFPDGEPDLSTPLGVAYMWWRALLDTDEQLSVLRFLTYHPPVWGNFTQVREELDGWAMAQHIVRDEVSPESIAHIRFIPDPGTSARAFADAPLYDFQALTLVYVSDEVGWKVWGLSHNRMPSHAEVIGNDS